MIDEKRNHDHGFQLFITRRRRELDLPDNTLNSDILNPLHIAPEVPTYSTPPV